MDSIAVGERVNSRSCREYDRERNLYKEPDDEVLKVFEILKDHDASTDEIARAIGRRKGVNLNSLIIKASVTIGSQIYEKDRRGKYVTYGWLGRMV